MNYEICECCGKPKRPKQTAKRWPANLIHDGSEEVTALFPVTTSGKPNGAKRNVSGVFLAHANGVELTGYGDTGSASRFFYCAKSSRRDRDEGLEGMEERARHTMSGGECVAEGRTAAKGKASGRNHHPCVKPVSLMQYLCRLVTPPGGVVLDPFCGSGSTGKAAVMEGFSFVGIDTDAEYLEIARRRIAYAQAQMQLPLLEAAQ